MHMRSRHGSIDIEVTVKRDELLERLRENREKHEREFNQAISQWQDELRSTIDAIKPDQELAFPHGLEQLREDCPVSHVNDYDQAIDMFGMCVTEEIKLDSDAFNTFCRDEWGWKDSLANNRFYRSVGVIVTQRNG